MDAVASIPRNPLPPKVTSFGARSLRATDWFITAVGSQLFPRIDIPERRLVGKQLSELGSV